MAEIIGREIHAGAIQRVAAFATSANFHLQTLPNIRTRLAHMTESWHLLQTAHVMLMQTEVTADERINYATAYAEMEETFLDTDAILRERIDQLEHPVQHDIMSERSDDSERHSIGLNDQINAIGIDNQDPLPIQNANLQNADQNANVQANVNQPQQVGQVQMVQQPNGMWPWQFRIDNIWGEFDGDRKRWPAFHDSFKTRIYDDLAMPAVQKFQILMTALKGKAAKSLGEWQICDRNFEPAWQRLKQLYDDSYTTTKELLQKLTDLVKLEEPNGMKLQIISNVTQEVYRQLQAMGYLVEHSEMIFIHMVQGKLDSKTSVSWDLKRQGQNPTLKEFTEFLDRQARALTNAHSTNVMSKSKDSSDNKRSYDKTSHRNDNKRFKTKGAGNYQAQQKSSNPQATFKEEKGSCVMCKQEHALRKCPEFLKLSLFKRQQEAKARNLCFKCLRSGHMISGCKFGPCPRCEKQHGAVLCPENPNNRHVNVAKKKDRKQKHTKKSTSSQ